MRIFQNKKIKEKQTAIITKGKPMARLVASNKINIPVAPIISSTGTLNQIFLSLKEYHLYLLNRHKKINI